MGDETRRSGAGTTVETASASSRSETMEQLARHVWPGKVKLYQAWGMDVVMGERQGSRFCDAYTDRSWLNCHSNGGVFNLGHRHPRVVAAVSTALEHLDIGNHHLMSQLRAELARRLAATTGESLPGVVFGVSGGEAVDLAIKVARGVTARRKVISVRGGYHGHTGLALATGDAEYREPFGDNLPGFGQVPWSDLEAMDSAIDDATAAVILEPVPATLGMPLPAPGYLEGVRRLCTERGAMLIVDEVQTGLGRTGRVWGYQHHDLVPDALVTGKGLSGGVYPITATLVSADLLAFFERHPFVHVSTFGGAELGCVAALVVLEVINEPGFLERVRAVAARFAQAFEPLPFALRQRGLMMGLELGSEDAGMAATKRLYDAGVFVTWANNDRSVVQFLPPLTVTDDEVEAIVNRVREAFA